MNAEISIQYDLFEPTDEVTCLKKEVLAVKRSADNVRRGVFQRLNAQGKYVADLEERIVALERKLQMLQENL